MADTTKKDRLKEITEGIEQGIQELFDSDRYAEYLRTMSRFHRYSTNNIMLIHMQKPDATLVAGFNKWRDQFQRHVRKGEKGIQIIAPTPLKKKIETQKLDPDTHKPVLNEDGTVAMEEKEVRIPLYKVVTVFDVSQTEGKPLPQLASDLHGDVREYDAFLEALRRASPVPVALQPMEESMDGYFSYDSQSIAIREGMSETQTVSAAIHEITHAKLHNYEQARLAAAPEGDAATPPKKKDRRTEEVEAESVSYAVCQYYGIQTGENSFGYIASWSKDRALPELRASLDLINKTASGLISDIDRHFAEICKERGIDLTAWDAAEQNAPHNAAHFQEADQPDSPERFAADLYDYFTGLHDAGLIDFPFSPDPREKVVPDLALDLQQGNFQSFRDWLDNAAKLTGAPSVVVMLDRLSKLEQAQTPAPAREALYLLDDAAYLHIQATDTGLDYTFYDKATLRQTDGGQLDYKDPDHVPENPLAHAQGIICAMEGQAPDTVEAVPLELLDTLLDAQQLPDAPAQAFDGAEETDAAAPEYALDEYPVPDPALTVADLERCDYLDGDMLPLSRDRALELYEQDLTIYTVTEGGEANMAFDREDIEAHGGLLAVPREEWQTTPAFQKAVADRLDCQPEREAAFLNAPQDAFAIYQLGHGDELHYIRFTGLDRLRAEGRSLYKKDYELIYTGPLTVQGGTDGKLERLFEQFNLDHPADFGGHSLSVSDIVVLRQGGVVTCHYCDNNGFTELPGFFSGENMLRAAEDALEQNDNQLDGLINNLPPQPSVAELERQASSGRPISLMDLAAAVHREQREKKASVVDKLKQTPPQQDRKKKAPSKGAEREI